MPRRCEVIGRRALPDEYVEFNNTWGVPYGWPASRKVQAQQRLDEPRREYGPFAYQIASGTRIFEYPWAFQTANAAPGSRVLDVGGCVGGLQFVFALSGCKVVNVDPFDEGASGWPSGSARYTLSPGLHERLNEAFGTEVELVRQRIQETDLSDGSFDVAVSVSVLEHLGQSDAEQAAARVGRLLAPGGLFVATIDLFLDLEPFGVLHRNCYGTNIDVAALVARSGLTLVSGDPRELFGFPEFDRDRVVANLDDILVAERYPVVSQAIVLRRPA
jgi:2-polyprenyl-3-methyl-5-hydroxy-6-metoxy-1,4-benzoquinol methylase